MPFKQQARLDVPVRIGNLIDGRPGEFAHNGFDGGARQETRLPSGA
jgi:hypothetical protein